MSAVKRLDNTDDSSVQGLVKARRCLEFLGLKVTRTFLHGKNRISENIIHLMSYLDMCGHFTKLVRTILDVFLSVLNSTHSPVTMTLTLHLWLS